MQAKQASFYSASALEKATGSGILLLCSTTPPMYMIMKHPVLLLVSMSSFQDESENAIKGLSKEIPLFDNNLVTGLMLISE
jgi:hypothetical protein